MNKLITLFVALLFSVGGFAAHAATPTVVEVEAKMIAGDYAGAKADLNKVLEKHPDSYVANRYLLELEKLEYAKTLQITPAYRIYEQRIAAIEVAKAEKDREEATKIMLWFVLFIIVLGATWTVVVLYTRHRKKMKKIAKKEAKEREWKGRVMPDLVDINAIISRVQAEQEHKLPQSTRTLLEDLRLDNIDAIRAIDNNDYEAKAIDRHIRDAKDYLFEQGFAKP